MTDPNSGPLTDQPSIEVETEGDLETPKPEAVIPSPDKAAMTAGNRLLTVATGSTGVAVQDGGVRTAIGGIVVGVLYLADAFGIDLSERMDDLDPIELAATIAGIVLGFFWLFDTLVKPRLPKP